jgi:hypothetical protein
VHRRCKKSRIGNPVHHNRNALLGINSSLPISLHPMAVRLTNHKNDGNRLLCRHGNAAPPVQACLLISYSNQCQIALGNAALAAISDHKCIGRSPLWTAAIVIPRHARVSARPSRLPHRDLHGKHMRLWTFLLLEENAITVSFQPMFVTLRRLNGRWEDSGSMGNLQ